MNTKIKKKTNNKTEAVVNATKRSSIAEHLINNTNCANNFDLSRFKIISNCTNSIDLIRLKAIPIFFINLNFVSRKSLIITFPYLFENILVNLF